MDAGVAPQCESGRGGKQTRTNKRGGGRRRDGTLSGGAGGGHAHGTPGSHGPWGQETARRDRPDGDAEKRAGGRH
jgi:hypothetical protein